ncbi:hypothetical protein LIER_07418 [Lithospermum erythrorhizon]|uniref:GOLD domain-containing protein n=1 Tax=Lithospermum erythrorhizon TaxID=34254 RepID=A0AAV3PCQ2_LITER
MSTTLPKIAELREALESVTSDQKYLKASESRHRHSNESTRKRVIFMMLALASALQVPNDPETENHVEPRKRTSIL